MPILMSFGCTITGVNATRVLDSGKQKLLSIITSWVVPCSAVWGVITLMGLVFFGSNVVWVILDFAGLIERINGVSETDSNGRAGLPINLLPKSYNAKVSFSAKGYVWKFHFATSFNFSLVKQLVGLTSYYE